MKQFYVALLLVVPLAIGFRSYTQAPEYPSRSDSLNDGHDSADALLQVALGRRTDTFLQEAGVDQNLGLEPDSARDQGLRSSVLIRSNENVAFRIEPLDLEGFYDRNRPTKIVTLEGSSADRLEALLVDSLPEGTVRQLNRVKTISEPDPITSRRLAALLESRANNSAGQDSKVSIDEVVIYRDFNRAQIVSRPSSEEEEQRLARVLSE